jgi:hypothetical protein
MMNTDTKITLHFHSAVPGTEGIVVTAEGFDSMHHAEMYGHHYAAQLSITHGRVMFLAAIQQDAETNFVLLCVPTYYAEGVTVISERWSSTNKTVCSICKGAGEVRVYHNGTDCGTKICTCQKRVE